MNRHLVLVTSILLCSLFVIMFPLFPQNPSETAALNETNIISLSQDTPPLSSVAVSIPHAPQLGQWRIALTLFNDDPANISIELSILLDGVEIIQDEVVLESGENYIIYTYDMMQLAFTDHLATVEVLISLEESPIITTVYSGSVVTTASWQLSILVFLTPILVVVIVGSGFLRRLALKQSLSIENARMNERGDTDEKVLAFHLYLNRGLVKSAIRVAVDLELPERMLQELVSSGSNAYKTLTQLAHAYDSVYEYEKASHIYRHLNLEAPYRRTSILIEVESGNMESAESQFTKMTSSRYGAESVKLILSLYERGLQKEALILCNSLEDKIRNLALHINKDAAQIKAFSALLRELDSDETKLNMLCVIGAKGEAADVIASSKTLKEIAQRSNLVSTRYRSEVVLSVIRQLAAKNKFKILSGYLKALNLTDYNISKLIGTMVKDLLDDPSNDNHRRLLKSLSIRTTLHNQAYISDILAAGNALSDFGGAKEIPPENISLVLRGVKHLRDYDIAKKLLDKVHVLIVRGRKVTELSPDELAIYSQQLRTITYDIKGQIAEYLKKRLQPMEDVLRPIIQKSARERILHILIHPDDEMKLATTSKHLTMKLMDDFPMQNPTAMAQALYELTRVGMFPELKKVIDTIISNDSLIRFVMDVLKNPDRRARLVLAAQRYEGTYRPHLGTIPTGRVNRVTRQLAISVWTERIHNVWVVGVFGALDRVVQNAMIREDIARRQKILLVAAYINRLHYAPSKIEGLVLSTTFKRLCAAAGFSPVEQRELITQSKLPRHVATSLRF